MKLLASNETEVPYQLGHETRKHRWRMVNTPDISLEIFLRWKCNPYQLTWFQNFVLQIITAYSWVALTWWGGHVGVQNNGKMSLKFCIIIESNSQKTSVTIVLYTNMAAVTSGTNQELSIFNKTVLCSTKCSLLHLSCTNAHCDWLT